MGKLGNSDQICWRTGKGLRVVPWPNGFCNSMVSPHLTNMGDFLF